MNPNCPACGKVIKEGDEVFFLSLPSEAITFTEPINDSDKGKFKPYFSSVLGKNIDVLIIPDNYQYGRKGDDICIIVCSEECNRKTRSAIDSEIKKPI